jgi:hypothetical protein
VGTPAEEAEEAFEHGAGGLILVTRYPRMRERTVVAPQERVTSLPVVEIGDESWRQILALANLTAIDAANSAPVLVMPLIVTLSVPYEEVHESEALNVIGMLPGTRQDARPLIVAAHYDGVGSLPDGTEYPGANKNASGMATMLEIARIWQTSGYTPERSIYFIAWGAEELNTATSQFYTNHPVFPLDKALGLLELDMLGAARSYYLNFDWETRGQGDLLFIRGSFAGRQAFYAVEQRNRERELLFKLELAADLVDRRASPERSEGTNTHEVFRRLGVPSVLVYWADASDIYTPDDTPESLDPYKLTTAGEVLSLATFMLAQ